MNKIRIKNIYAFDKNKATIKELLNAIITQLGIIEEMDEIYDTNSWNWIEIDDEFIKKMKIKYNMIDSSCELIPKIFEPVFDICEENYIIWNDDSFYLNNDVIIIIELIIEKFQI